MELIDHMKKLRDLNQQRCDIEMKYQAAKSAFNVLKHLKDSMLRSIMAKFEGSESTRKTLAYETKEWKEWDAGYIASIQEYDKLAGQRNILLANIDTTKEEINIIKKQIDML